MTNLWIRDSDAKTVMMNDRGTVYPLYKAVQYIEQSDCVRMLAMIILEDILVTEV
jgi:hypothetical protein